MNIQSITKLTEAILSDSTNAHFNYEFARVSKTQAALVQPSVNVNLTGAPRIIDSSAIRHTLRQHGNPSKEATRGQVAIIPADFEHVPDIIQSADDISYLGENPRRQPVFLFTKRIGEFVYFVVEAVRFAKRGTKLVFETMYKRK